MNRRPALAVAENLYKEHFANARVFFAAGSLFRGEGTEKSDIDCYVIYNFADCPRAYRETFIFQDYICECFVQNENSLEYFVAKELDNGIPIVLSMISEGHPFGDNKYAEELKQRAQDLLAKGPAPLDKTEINRNRYAITDLIDDIPARNEYELLGTLAVLHQRLGDFYLRSNGQWSGNRKALHRAIKKYNPDFAQKYGDAFEAAFKQNNFFQLERLVGKILLPFGGRLVVSEKDYASDKANQPKSNTGK